MTCRMEILNEIVVLLVGYHMIILMSSDKLNANKMSNIGISLITLIVALCVINTGKFFYDNARVTVLCCRHVKAKIVGKKRQIAFKKRFIKKSKILERLATNISEKQNLESDEKEALSDCIITDQD